MATQLLMWCIKAQIRVFIYILLRKRRSRSSKVNGLRKAGASMVVPPRKDAVLSNDSTRALSQRNQHILKIERMGRSDWRHRSGYYFQSHVENTFYRFKRIIGGRLRSKHDEAQKREALIGCAVLNRMLEIGRPVSYQVR